MVARSVHVFMWIDSPGPEERLTVGWTREGQPSGRVFVVVTARLRACRRAGQRPSLYAIISHNLSRQIQDVFLQGNATLPSSLESVS